MNEEVIFHRKEKAVSYDNTTKELMFHKLIFTIDELYQVIKTVEQKEKEAVNVK